MKYSFKKYLNEILYPSEGLFEEKKALLLPTLLFSVCFFFFYFTLIIIPLHGSDSIEFRMDSRAGSLVPISFVITILLSKFVKKNFIFFIPSLGTFFAGMIFLVHEEFFAAKNYLWAYAQVISIIYAVFLCSLRENLLLALINIAAPLLIAPHFAHLDVYEILDRQSVIFFSSIVGIYLSYKNTLNQRELKRLEKEKDEKAKNLAEAQHLAKIGNWHYSFITGKTAWSEQMFSIFSLDKSSIAPSYEGHKSIIHPEDVYEWETTIQDCIHEKRPSSLVYRTFKAGPEKKVIWVLARIRPDIGKNGKIKSLVGTCQDITEQKEIELKLEMERMKLVHSSKMAALGEMAGGIAHEINNPLAIISIQMDHLEKAIKKNRLSDEILDEVIESVRDTVQRITRIVQGLKTVSRDTPDIKVKKTNLREIFTDVLGLCSEKFKHEGITLDIDLNSSQFDKEVLVDRVQISQVFINLISNSYDAVQDLDEKWVKILVEETSDKELVKVVDSGKGIESDVQKKMFNPFYTSKEVGKGTGLGLSISKTIVQSNGGDLSLDKNNPHTCFDVTLPKAV